MNVEEAKKIAEAIKRAQLNELTSVNEIVKILTAEPATPVEKEYRAGEWVPKIGVIYWFIDYKGEIDWNPWNGDTIDSYQLHNVFPAEAIAEAAKKHAEWWRAFDMADEGGVREIRAQQSDPGRIDIAQAVSFYGNPKFKSEESARAWVDSHGGEAYVSEMLTKGRMFRFKWGGV